MVIFVESEKELHDFINLVKTEDVVAFPIFANQLDKRSSEITFIYFVSLKSNSKYVLNRTHLDASTFDLFKLLKTLTFTQKCYVEGLKWVFDIFRGDEIYDLQSVLYYTYNETESFKYLYSGIHIRDTLMLTDEAWAFSPILKTIESIDASLNPILNEISKFEITNKFYESLGLKQETNQIVEIRKNIFNLKKNSNNIKDLYENLIAEVRYKKFNFLTY